MLRPFHLFITIIAILSGLFFSSCDSYYFSRPQPMDRKDARSFPRAMRGQWVDLSDNEEMGGDVILGDALQTHYYIDKRRI